MIEIQKSDETAQRSIQRLAEHLVSEVMGDRCTIVGESGAARANRGRCDGQAVAIRWEDGFADDVCELHAAAAIGRGSQVIRPKRHNGEALTERPSGRPGYIPMSHNQRSIET